MRFALASLLALALAGCFQTTSTITVRQDGSARLDETVELSGLGALAMMEGESGKDGLDKSRFVARAAALGEGVTLVGLEETESGYIAHYAIADVRSFRFTAPDFDLSADDEAETVADDNLALGFEFEPGRPAALRLVVPEPKEDAREAEVAAPTEAQRAEMSRGLEVARALLGEARVTVEVVVEGDIVETDAPHVAGSTITVYDIPLDAVFDVLEEHPELSGPDRPPGDEISAFLAESGDVRIQPPGTVTVRFE